MGNLRAHSKGCSTCVQRRVKCDERRPGCRRCEKAGFDCKGFKDLAFVDTRTQIMKRFPTASKPRSLPTSTAVSRIPASLCQHDLGDEDPTKHFVPQIDGFPLNPNHPSSKDEIFLHFTVRNLCKGQGRLALAYSQVISAYSSSWARHDQCLLTCCILALSKVFYGVKKDHGQVLREGLILYSQGLNELNASLSNDNSSAAIDLVISVLSLSMIESLLPTRNSSWTRHIMGLERVFAVYGPALFRSKNALDFSLLESCRSIMIIGAFFTQRPSLMGNSEWKETMHHRRCDGNGSLIADLHFLIEVLAELPALFMDSDKCITLARKKRSEPSAAVDSIYNKVRQLQEALQAWRNEWTCKHEMEIHETTPAFKVDSKHLPIWRTVFHFTDVNIATTFAMYHSVTILLTSVPIALHQAGLHGALFVASKDVDYQVSSLSSALLCDVLDSVRCICRTIEYRLEVPKSPENHPDFHLFFPLHVAQRACVRLRQYPEMFWLSDAFRVMKSSYPMGVWANMDFGDRFSGFEEGLFG